MCHKACENVKNFSRKCKDAIYFSRLIKHLEVTNQDKICTTKPMSSIRKRDTFFSCRHGGSCELAAVVVSPGPPWARVYRTPQLQR